MKNSHGLDAPRENRAKSDGVNSDGLWLRSPVIRKTFFSDEKCYLYRSMRRGHVTVDETVSVECLVLCTSFRVGSSLTALCDGAGAPSPAVFDHVITVFDTR